MVDNVYSLLGQATTSEYRRRREEEKKYRRDLERDRLKATLLGAVLNPVMGSITQGITQGIADKFGGRFEDFQLRESTYRDQKNKTKEAYAFLQDYGDKQEAKLKEAVSTEEFVRNTYLPSLIEDSVNREALKNYGQGSTLDNIWKNDPTVKNEYLRGVADQVFDQAEVDELVKVFDAVKNQYTTAPDSATAWAKIDKDTQKAIGRDGLFPAVRRKIQGISIEDSDARGASVIENSAFASRVASILDLQTRLKEGKTFTLQEISDAFSATSEARKKAVLPDITNESIEIVYDPADGLLKEKKTILTKFARPVFDPKLNNGKGGFTDESKEVDIVKTMRGGDDVLSHAAAQIEKVGTLNTLFNKLNQWAQTSVRDNYNTKYGEGSFEKIMAQSELGFLEYTKEGKLTGKLVATPEQIFGYYQDLFKVMGQEGATNNALVNTVQNIFGNQQVLADSVSLLTQAQQELLKSDGLASGDPNKLSAQGRIDLEERIKTLNKTIMPMLNSLQQNTKIVSQVLQTDTYK